MVLANDMVGEQQQQSSSIHHQIQRSVSPNTSLTSSSSSPSSQAMANEQMSLYELRELATRQQERIETTQRLIMNREQKLKYLKHDSLLNNSINEYDKNLQRLKDSVSTQEIKLRQLRALKGQVQKQRCSNSNLCSELESIRTLFNEKEKELSVALTKVDALTRQLEELRKGNTTNSYHINGISNGKHAIELEKLRQELLYRTKLSEQQGIDLTHKKCLVTQRQSEMVEVDKRISELQLRLARKRQLNQQLSSQMHSNLSRTQNTGLGVSGLHTSNTILRSSVGHPGHGHKVSHIRPLSANIAAVEPLQREQQLNRINEIEQHINANKDFMGCKQDPKYQTLPYNTKFGVRQHQQQYKISAGNPLSVTTSENDKNDYDLPPNDNMNDILVNNISNNILNNNNNTNMSCVNHNNNTNNNSNTKLMNTKSSFIEERPSPSGSSGSSDRASIQNHYGMVSFKMQNNINISNAQHFQHQNHKSIGMSYIENGIHVKQLKPINNNNVNYNQQNSNQSVSQTYSVPNNTTTTSSQTQSQFTNNKSKVPVITKPKPILPPKPSIPVKPIPPPRQTPNHSYSAQNYSDSVDNAFLRSNANIDRKASNLLTSCSSPSTSSSNSYRFPLTSMAIQRAYNVINSKTGLMVQQLPHHSQHQQQQQLIHHSYEDKMPSHLNRNTESLHQLSIANVNETTDVPHLAHFNGQSLSGTDLTSSTSSTSSLSSSLSSQNNANIDSKSIASNSSTSNTNNDNINSTHSNSVLLKNDNNNDNYSTYKNNCLSNNVSNNSNNNNNSTNDWHKVKRRPVVANNEIEKELAMQISIASKKTIDTNQNISLLSQSQTQLDSKVQQSVDNNKVDSSLSVSDKQINQLDSIESKADKSIEKDNDSEIDLIKEKQQQRDQNLEIEFNSNSINESNNKNEIDEKLTADNLSPNYIQSKSIVGSKRTKGNLKSQQLTTKGDRNVSNLFPLTRRVSFDPLALLLDAALEGELELVKKTASEVPNPSAANDEGITALHNAICAGHFDIVKFLVENGCDVNAQDSDGWTPLHCAASCNNLAMVKFLVKNGACIFATTLSDQETAAEKCEEDEEGFDGCSQYLYGVQEKLGILNGSAVYAVYDYESQNADELSFKEGDVIIVMRKGDEQEREWWWAKIKDLEGYVPRNLLGLYPRVKHNKELQTINEEQCE